jgi:hypothetical protein
MTVEIRWDNADKTCILLIFGRHWSWREYNHAFATAHELMKSVSHQHKVHLIADLLATPMPQGNAMYHLRYTFARKPKNAGITVLVVNQGPENLFEQFILDSFLKAHRHHAEGMTMAVSLIEARAKVASVKQALSEVAVSAAS